MTAYLVATRAKTARKAVTARNQATTLTSGPWLLAVTHSGAFVAVRTESAPMV